MNEREIEILAERKMDRLDEAYLSGKMSEQDYERAIHELEGWVKQRIADEREKANKAARYLGFID